METEQEPWDREADEPGRWYDRFEKYRAMGPKRSLDATYREDGKGRERTTATGEWKEQAKRWRWKERAEKWDEHERRRVRLERLREVEALNTARLEAAKSIHTKALAGILALDTSTLTASELARLWKDAVQVEQSTCEHITEADLEELVAWIESLAGRKFGEKGKHRG